jgi:hypothetical protein
MPISSAIDPSQTPELDTMAGLQDVIDTLNGTLHELQAGVLHDQLLSMLDLADRQIALATTNELMRPQLPAMRAQRREIEAKLAEVEGIVGAAKGIKPEGEAAQHAYYKALSLKDKGERKNRIPHPTNTYRGSLAKASSPGTRWPWTFQN